MKKATVTVSLDAEKLSATKRYMGKKDADLESELADALQKLYEKYVPASIREYIDEREDGNALTSPTRPKKAGDIAG